MSGNADGSLEGIALKPLTVAFHEPGFIATLQQESQQPFWFMMSAAQRQQAGNPMGPANPQALNRYAYVLNSPIRYTDPSGHCVGVLLIACAGGVGVLYMMAAGGTIATQQSTQAAQGTQTSFDLPSPESLKETFAPDWLELVPQVVINVGNVAEPVAVSMISIVNAGLPTILTAKKADVKFIDHLQKKYGLTNKQREELHEYITGAGYSREEIEAEARALAEENKRKPNR